MKIYVVTETLHMGMDGDCTSITLVTRDENEAKQELERIYEIPYEEYNWYSGGITEFDV